MEMLVRATGARRALEVGTFTGYSALCIARGLPDDGRLLCCDVNETWTAIGRRYWDEAGVGDKIELRIGPAIDTLRALPATEQFDLAFVDADKSGYPAYIDAIVPRLRAGGLILVDNTLRSRHRGRPEGGRRRHGGHAPLQRRRGRRRPVLRACCCRSPTG